MTALIDILNFQINDYNKRFTYSARDLEFYWQKQKQKKKNDQFPFFFFLNRILFLECLTNASWNLKISYETSKWNIEKLAQWSAF